MTDPIRIAASQFPVSGEIDRNAAFICRQTRKAAANGATVVQFPETALSGYPPKHFETLDGYPWDDLRAHTDRIRDLAAEFEIWIVLGSMHCEHPSPPTSCLQVISDAGDIVATYDKQRLYRGEKAFFKAGEGPTIVTINGYRCGFLICYDNCFPELYEPYRDAGVQLLFHSFYNAANRHATTIRDLMMANLLIRAADNRMWIAASNSSERYSPLPACIARPDGSVTRLRRHVPGILYDDFPLHELGWTYDNRSV